MASTCFQELGHHAGLSSAQVCRSRSCFAHVPLKTVFGWFQFQWLDNCRMSIFWLSCTPGFQMRMVGVRSDYSEVFRTHSCGASTKPGLTPFGAMQLLGNPGDHKGVPALGQARTWIMPVSACRCEVAEVDDKYPFCFWIQERQDN